MLARVYHRAKIRLIGGAMKLDRSFIKSLPKVLLHEHLDGVLRPQPSSNLRAR